MSENTATTAKTFAERAASDPTDLHKAFAEWLTEKTGVKVDLKTVQLVTTMRMDFQKSDENQSALKERKANAEKAKVEAAAKRKAKLLAELAKLNGETETKTAEPVEVKAEDKADDVDPAATPAGTAPDGLGDKKNEPAEPKAPARRAPRTRRTTTAKK